MGRFHVKAELGTTTCGSEAIEAPANWEFDVILSKMPPSVYWNTGADAVEGTLSNDGKTFSFQSETVVNVGDGPGATVANSGVASSDSADQVCTVTRSDDSSGTFDSADSATSFSGTLGYHFAQEGGSACPAMLAADGFTALPCSMTYRMAAAWVSAR